MTRSRAGRGTLVVLMLSLGMARAQAQSDDDLTQPAVGPEKLEGKQLDFFEKKIRPVLTERCYRCHSAKSEKQKGGLALDTRSGIRSGGDSGPAVVPGKPGESLLVEALRYQNKDFQMPPKSAGGKLPDGVIEDFVQWIERGAPDPRDGETRIQKSEEVWAASKTWWAWKAPQKSSVPEVKDATWPRVDLDRFVLARLEAKNLRPVADADRATLLRRVHFDLVGLPPSPEELEAFVKDKAPDALERVVDALLRSPQFGERWGRHWLDVARYAESSGKDSNIAYPHAWRYRDWVIDAFNRDLTYDEFVREQTAGDLLSSNSDADRAAKQVATGFLAVGAKSLNEPNPRQFRYDVIDEQIDALSQAFLGMTIACARCHDHKFDPIPQR